jgi:hypothetical protein
MSGFLTALAAVQAEMPVMPKDKTNPHFGSRFTGLETVVATIGPLLSKHGLVWIAKPSHDESGPTLDYRLVHVETGEGEQGTMPLLLTKADSQGLGSALTYARRYALCSVLNLVSDDDDDGNAASSGASSAQQRPDRTGSGVTATEKQISYLKKLVKQKGATTEQLNFMLIEVGAQGVQVKDGWTENLAVGVCSALIDWLKERPLPDTEHPSDVPPPAEGEFIAPPATAEENQMFEVTS